MGDRRNVVVDFGNGTSVALYTHWAGSDLPKTLARAIERSTFNSNDPTYFTRIVFTQMIIDGGDGMLESNSGYGIEPFVTGEDTYCGSAPGYDLLVDAANGTVFTDQTGEVTLGEFHKLFSE